MAENNTLHVAEGVSDEYLVLACRSLPGLLIAQDDVPEARVLRALARYFPRQDLKPNDRMTNNHGLTLAHYIAMAWIPMLRWYVALAEFLPHEARPDNVKEEVFDGDISDEERQARTKLVYDTICHFWWGEDDDGAAVSGSKCQKWTDMLVRSREEYWERYGREVMGFQADRVHIRLLNLIDEVYRLNRDDARSVQERDHPQTFHTHEAREDRMVRRIKQMINHVGTEGIRMYYQSTIKGFGDKHSAMLDTFTQDSNVHDNDPVALFVKEQFQKVKPRRTKGNKNEGSWAKIGNFEEKDYYQSSKSRATLTAMGQALPVGPQAPYTAEPAETTLEVLPETQTSSPSMSASESIGEICLVRGESESAVVVDSDWDSTAEVLVDSSLDGIKYDADALDKALFEASVRIRIAKDKLADQCLAINVPWLDDLCFHQTQDAIQDCGKRLVADSLLSAKAIRFLEQVTMLTDGPTRSLMADEHMRLMKKATGELEIFVTDLRMRLQVFLERVAGARRR